MRRALPLVAIAISLLAIGCGTKAQKHEDAQAVANLRAAVPAVEAYNQDHNTYAGITLATLRKSYNDGIADIAIIKADKQTYCIEATAPGSRAFKNGPAAEIMLGSCSDPENGKPYTPPESNDESNASDPKMSLRASILAIEAYYQDHNTYAGMTVSKLRQGYDYGLPDITIVSATKETYCVEAEAGSSHAFKNGPAAEIMLGSCSIAPPIESPDAAASLRASMPSIEAYRLDHKTYVGMTLQKLRQGYDNGLPDIKIVSAKKMTYCVEITVDSVSAFMKGLAYAVEQGHCPT